MTEPNHDLDEGVPEQTDNGDREFDPAQDISQDPEVDFSGDGVA